MSAGLRLKGHSMLASDVQVGSATITGYGEDGGIDIVPNADLAEITVGADGETIVELLGDDNYIITIKVLPTSRAHLLLEAALETQLTAAKAGVIIPQPFFFRNRNTGRAIASDRSFFLRRPDESHNKKVASREYVLVVGNPTRTPPVNNAV